MSTTPDGLYASPDFEAPDPDPWDAPIAPPVPDAGSARSPWADADPASFEAPEAEPIDTGMAGASTPEAIEHEKTSGRRDLLRQHVAGRHARGVEWVRPTDLFSRIGGTASGRGIDYTAELSRRLRGNAVTGLQEAGARARKLPGLTMFGRRGHGHQAPTRTGVGME